jgi:hypothetical protein
MAIAWQPLSLAPVREFRPEAYGAKRDGTTDDSAAIRAARDAAIAAAPQNGYVAKVKLSSGTYLANDIRIGNGQSKSIIEAPIVVPESDHPIFLYYEGVGKATAKHWADPLAAFDQGTVIKTTLTGQTSDGTYGPPSVFGSPFTAVGANGLAPNFTNVHICMDGITVLKPQNPSLVSFDLRGFAKASIGDLASHVNAAASALVGNPGSNGLGVGLMMPGAGNNAVCDIGSFTSEGDNCAVVLSEHVIAKRILALYNATAVFIDVSRMSVTSNHKSVISYLCAEGVNTVIDVEQVSNNFFALTANCDTELANSGTHYNDPGNFLRGDLTHHDYNALAPRVTGCGNVRIIDDTITRGAFTPTLPATTAASTPIYRDMALTVSGGTVTAITVDGVAQGVTSGTVFVPTGKTFAITYSVAPTLRAVKY